MSLVSWIYNTSLYQFFGLLHMLIDTEPKAQLLKDRVQNIINTFTYSVYRYINRGFFEKDKIIFKLMVSLKILIEEVKLMPHDVQFLLKLGAGANDERAKQFSWMEAKTWLKLKALSIDSQRKIVTLLKISLTESAEMSLNDKIGLKRMNLKLYNSWSDR